MEVGVYSFGHRARQPDGSLGSTARSIADLLEGIRLADQVGLDFFGVREHHRATSRHILQMDLGHIPQRAWLEAIELLGTRVAPEVRAATGPPTG